MKKFCIALIGAACFSVVVISCKQPKNEEVSPSLQQEPTSVIDLMEKEEGVKFFKKDITLKDVSGKNTVVIRFASHDLLTLENYLSSFDFEITPVFKRVKNELNRTNKILELSNQKNNSENSVLTEALSKNLDPKAMGYQLNIKLKAHFASELKNGRGLSFNSECVHISDAWPEEFKISLTNGQNEVQYVVDKRMRWYYAWTYWFGWYSLSAPNAQVSHWLDGPEEHGFSPWKVRVKVAYNPVFICGACLGTTPGYNIEFYNHW
ncbi:MAG: hypothetical protein ACK4GN_05150 [Runella sp.]